MTRISARAALLVVALLVTLGCESDEAKYQRLSNDAMIYDLNEQALRRRLDSLSTLHAPMQGVDDSLASEWLTAHNSGDTAAKLRIERERSALGRTPEMAEVIKVRQEWLAMRAKAAIAKRDFDRFSR